MELIIDNWSFIVAIICVVFCALESVLVFVEMPNDKKLANLREWLLYAVVEAEKIYKGGTGALKLRYVYNLAVDKFSWLPRLISFEMFSSMVDDALEWMKVQLESNKNIQEYVDGSKDNN